MIAVASLALLLAAHSVAKPDPCARLDAAGVPACAGRLPREENPPVAPRAAKAVNAAFAARHIYF